MSHSWRTLRQQADIAMTCLKNKQEKQASGASLGDSPTRSDGASHEERAAATGDNELLPYLIHASVLFFTMRDVLAFLVIQEHCRTVIPQLFDKVRHMPSYQQLQAILKSNPESAPWVSMIEPLSDEALVVQELKRFRDAVIQHGIPLEAEDLHAPFPLPLVNYAALTNSALQAWDKLHAFSADSLNGFPLSRE